MRLLSHQHDLQGYCGIREASSGNACHKKMSSTLLKQADKITLGLVAAAGIAILGDAYFKRAKTAERGRKVVNAMQTEKERMRSDSQPSSSVQADQVSDMLHLNTESI